MRRVTIGRLCLGGAGIGSSLDPRPATDRAYKQPLPSSRLDPGKKTVCGMIIIKKRKQRDSGGQEGPSVSGSRVQTATAGEHKVQWDGIGQDTINSRCKGGCTVSPCINIDPQVWRGSELCAPSKASMLKGVSALEVAFFGVCAKSQTGFKDLLKELQGLLCGRDNNLLNQGQGLTEGQRCLFILLAWSRNESNSVIFHGASTAVEGVYSLLGVPLEAPGRGQPRGFACAWGLSCHCRRQLPSYRLTRGSHQISSLSKARPDHGRLSHRIRCLRSSSAEINLCTVDCSTRTNSGNGFKVHFFFVSDEKRSRLGCSQILNSL